MILNNILILLKTNFILFTTFFIKQFIPTIENISFVIYLRFIWNQIYKIFYFIWGLFAKHHKFVVSDFP